MISGSDLVFAALMAGLWWLISSDLFSPSVTSFDLAALIAGAGYVAVLLMAAMSILSIDARRNVRLQQSLKRAALGFWLISIGAYAVVRWLPH
jgi:hypothetical protein